MCVLSYVRDDDRWTLCDKMMGAVVFSWGVDLLAREFTAVVGFGLRITKHMICQDSFCFSQAYVS